ncbi:cytochrome-c peroxidase [Cyclobacterium amurskyense]|uniref:Cytochrome c551 peroxidase n=1 Tax=Cyclobacterium amurskyense TaxID=320787 RepID=A0A0H4P6X5_9BACT|nr:cytochrome c peroxidase [Cyclobacterium amurskyense]AKP49919.1 Cytochrome c551 peroxidase [Cyclobacterium amurskyense]
MDCYKISLSFILLAAGFLNACLPVNEDMGNKAPEYFVPVPSSSLQQEDFPQPERNYLSKEGVELGKTLFFDPGLSANGKVSCAGCHLPEKAFSDGLALTNIGVSGLALHRNSPALFNLAWHDGLFWEGGANDLESMVFGPLTHPDEMAADLNKVLQYLNSHETYPQQFQEAFPTDSITSAAVARSLAQFMRTLISDDSKYDQWKREEASLTSEELKGYEVYKEHCSSCHKEGLFTDLSYHNNGLDSSYPDPPELEGLYQGRYRITYKDEDMGAYKTASLRNLSFTAPYMHDGRFTNLEEVLDHYESGIKTNGTLAPQLENGIVLNAAERTQLLAFINSLNDYNFITNPAYQK